MRTTLTLEPDVAALLKRAMRENKSTLKAQVNAALRVGLAARRTPRRRHAVTRSFDGGPALLSLESISQALALAEGDAHR
jgi:hypothetical protein